MDELRDNRWLMVWLGILLVIVALAVPIARALLDRFAVTRYRLPALLDKSRASIRTLLLVIGAQIILAGAADPDDAWVGIVSHALTIGIIAAITWFLIDIVEALEEVVLAHLDRQQPDNTVGIRRAWTQVTLLRRLISAVLIVIGAAVVLTTFPSVNLIGTSVLASAGLISIVAGLAAQTSLTNVFAGIQLALSDALRVGDVVQMEDESGVVHDITLTYVVIGLWDDRKLILPSSYFISEPFENWTRSGDRIGGTVFIDVDWTVPIARMRAELEAALAETPLWDGRTGSLNVADATGGQVRIRIDLSAKDTSSLFGLNAYVRERMVTYLQEQGGTGLPRQRIESLPMAEDVSFAESKPTAASTDRG
jgi:small-conductance mechanosensitive channel